MRDLRARLGVILALALLPLLIFTMWKSYSDYNRDQALLRNNTDLTARIALTEIVGSFDTTRSILRFTSTLLAEDGCRADLRRLTAEYPRFYNLIQADSSGLVKCSAKEVRATQSEAAALLKNLSEENPFHTAILNLENPNGEPEKVLVTVHASFTDRKVTGVFAAVEDISYLLSLLQRSNILDDSELAIINQKGEILGGDWYEEDLQAIASNLTYKEFQTRLTTKDKTGRPLLVLPTPAENIYLAVASKKKNFLSWNKFNPLTYAALPILAWIFGFAAIWLSTDQLILIHLRRMRSATLKFAKGDRNVRVGKLKNPPASIYALGKNFDLMADKIAEREATIKDSLSEKETLLREIHHRVKNNLQIIISLLNMQERKLTDNAGSAAITETRSRINAIALVHRGLYESTDLRVVDMQKFLDRLLPELTLALGLQERGISIKSKAECEPMEADTATPVALFIVEALTNSVKHGVNGGGEIDINVMQNGSEVSVSVTDMGKKASIKTSKTKTPGNGMGTKLMKGFARQLGGTLETETTKTGYQVALNFAPREINHGALI